MFLYLTYSLSKIWNYSLIHEKTSKGGGVAIYCKKNFNPKLIPGLVIQNTFTFESIAIEIQLEHVSVLIGSYYRSNKYFSINNSSNHFEPFLTSYYLF